MTLIKLLLCQLDCYKMDQLKAALQGHQMRDSHRFLITRAMRHMAFLADEIEALDQDGAQTVLRQIKCETYAYRPRTGNDDGLWCACHRLNPPA